MYITLLLVIAVHKAETLKCLKCYSSNDAECDMEEKSGICGAFDDTCYSLTYVFVPSGKSVVEHGFKKGCVNRNVGCEMYCRQFLEEGYKSCNIECCKGDHCNKDGFQKIEYKMKSKRASSRMNGSSSSSAVTSILLLILNCMCLCISFLIS